MNRALCGARGRCELRRVQPADGGDAGRDPLRACEDDQVAVPAQAGGLLDQALDYVRLGRR
jgi:hypothetical protein